MPSSSELRSLFRQYLRQSKAFPSYNIREYLLRRVKEDFRKHASVDDESTAQQLWDQAVANLELVKRQLTVYHLFGGKVKSVLEIESASRGNMAT